jgi:Protein of unknown function (DUF3987)
VSPDLPAMLALTALSVACAKKITVNPEGEWVEHVNLFLATALPPSAGKSPAFKAMLGAINEFEAEIREESEEKAAVVEVEKRVLEGRMKNRESMSDTDGANEIRRQIKALPSTIRPQLTTSDVTQEAMVKILSEQGGRLALISPEGGVFDMMLGRYSDQASLTEYLSGFSGENIKVDRKTAGSFDVSQAVLTIGVTVQPVVLEALADPRLRRKGLSARFMYSLPESKVGQRNYLNRAVVDRSVGVQYAQRLRALLRTMNGVQTPGTFTFTPEATHLFNAWRQGLEDKRGNGKVLEPLAEWLGKLENTVVRVCGLLAASEDERTNGSIGVDVLERALTIGEYWLEHAKAVHDMWGMDPVLGQAKMVVRWLTNWEPATFSLRDSYASNRRLFPRAEDAVPALELLIERGWIRCENDGPIIAGKRGTPSPVFHLHPEFKKECAQAAQLVTHGEGGSLCVERLRVLWLSRCHTYISPTKRDECAQAAQEQNAPNDDWGLF